MYSDVPTEQLTDSQRRAVFHRDGPLLVLAGPGSGKTRVISCRIAALIEAGVRPDNICAITFTNKAAEEMRRRLAGRISNGVHISTFHSLCVRILRRYAEAAGIRPNFSIYDTNEQMRCMKETVRQCDVDTSNFPPARMLEFVSNLKNDLESVEQYRARADDYFGKTVARIYAMYQQILEQNNAMDFDDLLTRTAFLLRDRPDIREELSRRFGYLLVDEYQDTNHAQYQIAKGLALAHGNICVTGDPDQSIYRWRGADIENILAFEKDWPNAKVIRLEENFRSMSKILEIADRLIAFNAIRKHKMLIATRGQGGRVDIFARTDERDEACQLAEQLQQLLDEGVNPNRMAVFYRVNSMSRAVEEAFIRRHIPYQVVRGVEFYSRKEIQDMLSYLKLIANPSDDIALVRAIGTHSRGIGKNSVDRLIEYAKKSGQSLLAAARSAGKEGSIRPAGAKRIEEFAKMIEGFAASAGGEVAPLMDIVFAQSGLADALRAAGDQTAIENINELINAAAEFDGQTENPNLLDYLQSIALYSDSDAYDPDAGRVSLMTLHAAKGLEFDYVFIIGLEEGLLPHERSRSSKDDLEEERRLFFVGVTRAREALTVSYARYRTLRGQFIRSMPSQFLYEIGYAGQEQETADAEKIFEPEQYLMPQAVPDICGQSDYERFSPRQLVEHSKFGLGRVKEFLDLGADSVVVVQFNSGKTKSLMLKYAKLRRPGSGTDLSSGKEEAQRYVEDPFLL